MADIALVVMGVTAVFDASRLAAVVSTLIEIGAFMTSAMLDVTVERLPRYMLWSRECR